MNVRQGRTFDQKPTTVIGETAEANDDDDDVEDKGKDNVEGLEGKRKRKRKRPAKENNAHLSENTHETDVVPQERSDKIEARILVSSGSNSV